MSSSSKDGLLAVSGSLLGLSAITLSLRFYARKKSRARLMMDDWVAAGAFIPYLGAAICIFIAVHNKVLGYDSNDLKYSQAATPALAKLSALLQVATNMLGLATLAGTKMSAVFFYRRIFCVPGPTKWIDIVTTASIIIVALWFVAFEILIGLQCGTHFAALWNGSYAQYCVYSFANLKGLTISDFLLEIWILTVPIPRIVKLHISVAKKFSVAGVFLLGSIGLGASIARVVQIIQAELGGAQYFLQHNEERTLTSTFFFIMLEAGISLVAINLPSLWILVTSCRSESLSRGRRTLVAALRTNRSDTSNMTQSDKTPSDRLQSERRGSEPFRVLATRHVEVVVQRPPKA